MTEEETSKEANEYKPWEAFNRMSGSGRHKTYTRDEFAKKVFEYFEITEKRTIKETVFVGKDGQRDIKEHKVPFQISGLCLHLELTRETLRQYRKDPVYSDIVTHADNLIHNQKFEGAACGMYNASIIARSLGLIDKQRIETEVIVPEIKVRDLETKSELDKIINGND